MGDRQQEILREIVESYIKNFEPIPSKALVDKFNCSSATIRNDMAELEELGYLEKEHTSSGRIPSEKGYKFYVNNLMKPKELTGEDVLKLQTILNNNNLVISDAIEKCMEIISDITHYTTVVIGPNKSISTLRQIQIIPLDKTSEGETTVLAVLITNQGDVEKDQIVVSKDIDVKELIQTCEIINKALVGTAIDKVVERLELEIKPRIREVINQYEQVYNFFSNAFHDFAMEQTDVVFGGKTNLLDFKEYEEPEKLKEMITKLEDTDLVRKIDTDHKEVKVYIGDDNEFDPDTTVIKTHYNVDGSEGTIAIIGPKRMEYDKVVTLLNFLKEYIEK